MYTKQETGVNTKQETRVCTKQETGVYTKQETGVFTKQETRVYTEQETGVYTKQGSRLTKSPLLLIQMIIGHCIGHCTTRKYHKRFNFSEIFIRRKIFYPELSPTSFIV